MTGMGSGGFTSKQRWSVVAVMVLVAAGFFFAFRSDVLDGSPQPADGGGAAGDAIPVAVTAVGLHDLVRTTLVNGQIVPVREVALVPKVSGVVQWLAGDVGTQVGQGDVVLRLEDDDLQAQYRQAEASLEAAEANLERLQAGATSEEREQAAASLKQAEMNLEQARLTLTRVERLYGEGAVSQDQLDTARTQFGVAEAQFSTAEQQVIGMERGAAPADLRAARAQVDQARASLELAGLQLDRAEVRAPIDGLIVRRNVEEGTTAQAGNPALHVVDMDQVYVQTAVTQTHVNRIQQGAAVDVEVSAAGGIFPGQVHTVSPVTDSAGVFPVRVKLDNPDHILKAGMFANVRIPVERVEQALAVPSRAVVRSGEDQAVFVIVPQDETGSGNAGVARLRPLRLGMEAGGLVVVHDGIEAGEWVVITGQGFLRDGRPVVWTEE